MLWFKVAAKTGMSVQRAKLETTSTEFLKWEKFFEEEANFFHREDWLFAQMCFQIYLLRLSFGGGKVELEPKDFLIKFTLDRKDKEKEARKKIEEMSPEEVEAEKKRIADAGLAAWGSWLGLDPETHLALPPEKGGLPKPSPGLANMPVPYGPPDGFGVQTRPQK